MRNRELRLIITFNSTTDAMQFEKFCRALGIEGRLIPVPRTISASCGLCWRARPEDQQRIEAGIAEARLAVAGLYQMVI